MKTIWKYEIKLEPVQSIDMPIGAEILTLHKQGSRREDEVYVWCLLDTEKPTETRSFLLVETGEEIHCENCEYVGTLWFLTGTHVVHMVEIKKG
jgi:hypothetical protein